MKFPKIAASPNPSAQITQFGGLNRQADARPGEFWNMKNLSSDAYPNLTARAPRRETGLEAGSGPVQAVISSGEEFEGFTGIAGGSFYYKGTQIPFEDDTMQFEGKPFCLAEFNGKIFMAPNMYYYSPDPDPVTGKVVQKVRRMERGYRAVPAQVYSQGDPQELDNVSNYIQAEMDWAGVFSVGDAVAVTGFSGGMEINNTRDIDSRTQSAEDARPISAVVEKIETNRLYLQLYNRKGARLVFKNGPLNASGQQATLDVIVPVPKMNWICVHLNRLWGTNPNGERIYASKIGDPFNFYTFEGLATDSWYSEIGTRGGFTGLCSYRDNIVAFKREYIHQVYGDKPSNYSIPKQLSDCGCMDMRSVCQIGAVLYFLGSGGFYAYTGGQPRLVSEALQKSYQSAVAMTDGKKYYVSARQQDGGADFLVLDPDRWLWHQEDDLDAVGFFRAGGRLYAAAENALYCFGEGEEPVQWMAEFVPLTEDSTMEKGICDLFIQAELFPGSRINVLTAVDGNAFTLWSTLEEEGFHTFRVPVRMRKGSRYQLRLEGEGKILLHAVERVIYGGGKRYSR